MSPLVRLGGCEGAQRGLRLGPSPGHPSAVSLSVGGGHTPLPTQPGHLRHPRRAGLGGVSPSHQGLFLLPPSPLLRPFPAPSHASQGLWVIPLSPSTPWAWLLSCRPFLQNNRGSIFSGGCVGGVWEESELPPPGGRVWPEGLLIISPPLAGGASFICGLLPAQLDPGRDQGSINGC